MIYKFEYSTSDERDSILSNNKDKCLIEEQNFFDGNFLIFTNENPSANSWISLKEDVTDIAETTAGLLGDSYSTAETLAQALLEIENLKSEIITLKGV